MAVLYLVGFDRIWYLVLEVVKYPWKIAWKIIETRELYSGSRLYSGSLLRPALLRSRL
jgi:hypothetical protein